MNYIGITSPPSGEVNDDTIMKILNDACRISGVTTMSIDFSRDFVHKKATVHDDEYEFIEVAMDNDPGTVSRVVDGILSMKIPCYRGDVFYKTMYQTVFEKGVILHAPDSDGNIDGGIRIVKSIIDMSCSLEFPVHNFADAIPAIVYFPIELPLPASYASFLRAIHARQPSSNYQKYLEQHVVNLATACVDYWPGLVWEHDVPQPISIVMDNISPDKEMKALRVMNRDDIEWLGIDLAVIPDLPVLAPGSRIGEPAIQSFSKLLSTRINEDAAMMFAVAAKSYLGNTVNGKTVRMKMEGNKIMLELIDDALAASSMTAQLARDLEIIEDDDNFDIDNDDKLELDLM